MRLWAKKKDKKSREKHTRLFNTSFVVTWEPSEMKTQTNKETRTFIVRCFEKWTCAEE
jgi:hypothetical protein